MTKTRPSTLRDTLRTKLRPAHDTLDAILSGFDLRTPAGAVAFMRTQFWGFAGIPFDTSPTRAVASDLARRAQDDLLKWTGDAAAPSATPLSELHPVAAAYVVGGARIGNRILRQRWNEAQVVNGLGASAFFDAPDHDHIWQFFLAEAAKHESTSSVAQDILRDAAAIFNNFTVCAEEARTLMDRYYD